MRGRDIVIGLIVLGLLVWAALWIRKTRLEKQLTLNTPTVEEKISKTFNNLEIPSDVEKAELKDVSGGNGFGIMTRDMVLADLPDLENGNFYQVWQESSGVLSSLGKMRIAKGGFLFEGRVGGDKIVVTKEKFNDGKPEERILEGSF